MPGPSPVWTPPHFWALALERSADYARAGVPALPVVAGREETKRRILRYSLLLVVSSALPWALGYAGAVYAAAAAQHGLAVSSVMNEATPATRARAMLARLLDCGSGAGGDVMRDLPSSGR